MVDWSHELTVVWLAVLVFAATALVTAAIYAAVTALAVDEGRQDAFKRVSPGMLPPLGLVFGLVVGFLAAQVWSDADRAQQAVHREARSARSTFWPTGSPARPRDGCTRSCDGISRTLSTLNGPRWPGSARP